MSNQQDNQDLQKLESLQQSSQQNNIKRKSSELIEDSEQGNVDQQQNTKNSSQKIQVKEDSNSSENIQQKCKKDCQNQNGQNNVSQTEDTSQNNQELRLKANNKEKKINSDMKHFLSLLQKVEQAKLKKEQLTKAGQDVGFSQQDHQNEFNSNKDEQDDNQQSQFNEQQQKESQCQNKDEQKNEDNTNDIIDNQDNLVQSNVKEQKQNKFVNSKQPNYEGKSQQEVYSLHQNDIDIGFNSYSMQDFERKQLDEEYDDDEDERLIEFQRLEDIQKQENDFSSKKNFEEIQLSDKIQQNSQDQRDWKEIVEDENLSVIYSDANESRRSTHDNTHFNQSHKEKQLIEETINLITQEIEQEDKLIPILQNFKSIQMNYISKQQLLFEENEKLKLKADQLNHKNQLLEKTIHFSKQQIKHLESQNTKLLDEYEYIQREVEKMRQLEKELKHSLNEAKQMNLNFSELLRIKNEENKQKEFQSKMIMENYKKLGIQMSQFQQNYGSLNESIKLIVTQVLESLNTDKEINQNRLLSNFSQDSNFKSTNSDKFPLQTDINSLLDQQSDSSFLKNVSSPTYLNYQSENIHNQNKRLSYIQRAGKLNDKNSLHKSKDSYSANIKKKRPSNILIELGDNPSINKSPINKSASVSPIRKNFKPHQFSNPFYYSQTTRNSQNQSSKAKQIQETYKNYLSSKK
ncbi:hypothetical protein TTHERM_00438980 (macronuclear) [Tetrahymena thermophila SB210]|uniref:Uncharacterized protein n=1 Tax=Tetrahymena thermophila (strain SB210) TaxID=312017 RepID=I7M8B3_TETTS|nr:hypothetical protein TTHERM_00438980 [Tetrahymena thermophila SB210]EAR97550.2 hypothetical protein TTHERM_00438980 [Tetrahymena thermophila SB210]|eukprot:XP_001017795.2 hypothetical protein TTHERM_00438980 [Tetrahymena thermophila SB210]